MPLEASFPIDPYVVLDPDIRWYPGDQQEMFTEDGYARLLPPLVYAIRKHVKEWRSSGYAGASDTTRALLIHWFKTEHLVAGSPLPFRYFFAQREAVESAIWLYEVAQARDPYALIKYDSSGRVSKAMFDEDWTRYVMKMATGAGKTKVMSLLVAWAYSRLSLYDVSPAKRSLTVAAGRSASLGENPDPITDTASPPVQMT